MRLDDRLSTASYWVSTALTLAGAGYAFLHGHYGWGLAILVVAIPMLTLRQIVLRVVDRVLASMDRPAAPRPTITRRPPRTAARVEPPPSRRVH